MKRWVKMMRFIGGLCIITLVSIAYITVYLCRDEGCGPVDRPPLPPARSRALPPQAPPTPFEELVSGRAPPFDLTARDVIVFLHIQKTGGTTFGRHLVRDLNLTQPCTCPRKRKRCDCFRPGANEIGSGGGGSSSGGDVGEQWLFSRFSTGWKCGLHADWTELVDCVQDALDEYEGVRRHRRYFYITLLRDPVHRFLSEFRHVQRGATWKGSRHWCGGRESIDLPLCYQGANWTGVEIDEFLDCEWNLAHNRQTRMLADLSLVGCYNSSLEPAERDRILLSSAKENLARMAYFGLTELQTVSQYIFEQTLGLRFVQPFEQFNATLSVATLHELSADQMERIRRLNRLDVELYAFGRRLLEQRFRRLRGRDADFDAHWNAIVNRPSATPPATPSATDPLPSVGGVA